jgi:hypothetical protein
LRAKGLSYRAIGEELGYDSASAWRDCTQSLEVLSDEQSTEAIKQELLEIHRFATGALVEDLENQRAQGQVETIRQPDGSTITKTKAWLNPQTLAELGRTCQRIAQLLGLTESGPDDQGSASFSATTINLVSPGDAASFQQRSQQLAAARQAEPAPIEVSVVEPPQAAQSEPQAAEQQEAAPTEPLEPVQEPLTGWRAKRAARKAQEASSGRPAVRFLDSPLRN